MRLKDKIAIIVGAGQSPGEGLGNGRATALRFVQEGAKVLAVDRDLASAEETARLAGKEGGECIAFEADVTKERTLAGESLDALNARLQSWLANAPAETRAVVERYERTGLFTAEDRYHAEYDDAVEKIYPRNPERRPGYTPPSFVEAVRGLAWDVYFTMWGRDGEFRLTGTLAGWDGMSRIRPLAVPVLLLVSRHGMWTTDEAESLAKKLPDARVVVFEHSGHMMFADEPDRFVEIMESSLRPAAKGRGTNRHRG